MSTLYPISQAVGMPVVTAYRPPVAFPSLAETHETDVPVWKQAVTWILYWPLLTLIARQPVLVSGPAKTAMDYQMGGARGSHIPLYINVLLFFVIVVSSYRKIWAVVRKNPLILASLLLCIVSAQWSASPTITFQMSIEVGLCTLFACYLSARLSTERLISLLMFMGVTSALLSIFFAVALPSYGIFVGYAGGAWQGITNHKNTLGISMAFLLTPVFFTKKYGIGQKFLYILLMLFLIGMSQSRGAWIDTLGMLLFVGWIYLIRRLRLYESMLLFIITSAVVILVVSLGVIYFDTLTRSIGKDPTMSGRFAIYVEVWKAILKQPLFGYGFGGFWFPGSLESKRVGMDLGWPNIGYSESGVLELALQTGFVGLGLVFAMMGQAIIQAIRLLRSPFYTPRVGWFLSIFFLVFMTNIDAGWFMTWDTLDWVLIVVACVGLAQDTRRAAALKAQARGIPSSALLNQAY